MDSGSTIFPMKRTPPVKGSRRHMALNIRVARVLCGWSQEALGLECGLKRTYVGALERAELNPGVDNVDRIGHGLGVPAYVLLMPPDVAQPSIYRHLSGKGVRRQGKRNLLTKG